MHVCVYVWHQYYSPHHSFRHIYIEHHCHFESYTVGAKNLCKLMLHWNEAKKAKRMKEKIFSFNKCHYSGGLITAVIWFMAKSQKETTKNHYDNKTKIQLQGKL